MIHIIDVILPTVPVETGLYDLLQVPPHADGGRARSALSRNSLTSWLADEIKKAYRKKVPFYVPICMN